MLLTSLDWDADLAAARLLGTDVRAQMSTKNAEDLELRWASVNHLDLARALDMPAGVAWTGDLKRRLALISELSTGLSAPSATSANPHR